MKRRLKKIDLPAGDVGFVFVLVSTKRPDQFHIDHGVSLRSLFNHNSGQHEDKTSSRDLRQWGIYLYVCGFDDNPEKNIAQREELATDIEVEIKKTL